MCLLELGNVLNNWSYDGSLNNIERRRLMYARKRSRMLRRWIERRYELLDSEGNAYDFLRGFFAPYIILQARALLLARRQADNRRLGHRDEGLALVVTWDRVQRIIEESLHQDEVLWELWANCEDMEPTYAWAGPKLTVRRMEGPYPGEFFDSSALCNYNR